MLVGALAWAAVSVAGVTGAAAATIEGQAFDREGRSLPKISVTLVERLKDGHEQVVASVATDPHGFFQFDTGPRSVKGKVIVRCGDPAQWDTVRYAPPAEVDVTRTLREKDRAIVSCIAEDAPQWPAVRREIERSGGEGSDRGRILRQHGLPPQSIDHQDGRIEWHYPKQTFVFRDGVLVSGGEASTPEGGGGGS